MGGQWEAQDGGAGTGWDGWRALRERVRVRGGMRMAGDKGKGSSEETQGRKATKMVEEDSTLGGVWVGKGRKGEE